MANELIIRHGLISKGGVSVPFTSVNNVDFTAYTADDYYIEVALSNVYTHLENKHKSHYFLDAF